MVGLAAHVGGFLLKTSATAEPLALVADLLYALGWSLWTGVVVVFLAGGQTAPAQAVARCLRSGVAREGPSWRRPGVGDDGAPCVGIATIERLSQLRAIEW